MTKIGLISDTHGFFDMNLRNFLSDCDEIWHAGDIGNIETANSIANFKPLKAVYGNIDDYNVRQEFQKDLRFNCEKVTVFMTHIGGYPGKYDIRVKQIILNDPPKLFISGHSHILKIIPDKKLGLLHINPGAAGKNGLHRSRTAVRFNIDSERIHNLEVWELKR